jgi:FtsP/CotA-like multicopper oxidase with cupredoxin domain
MRINRRQFLAASGALGAGLFLTRAMKADLRRALAASALPGDAIPKYLDPLVIPPAMPKAGSFPISGGKGDYYEICVRQFQQYILPASMGLPKTTVWSYQSRLHDATLNFPAFTIEAKAGVPVRVKWINDLVDANGRYLPHLLPVDPTLHWANPGGGVAGRDTRPVFDSTPGRYMGPVPMVPHVHGAIGVGPESDGYAEAWWLPAARNIPGGYAREGTWYNYFKSQFYKKFKVNWARGQAEFQYPNQQRAATIWYHDHTLGMTRLNVYAGPAGFYIVRGGPADVVLDSSTGGSAVLPGPAPRVGSNPFGTFYEIPIAVQDRSFNLDGSLFYPDTRAFFDQFAGPYIPGGPGNVGDPGFVPSDVSPIWNPEFFGNTIVVNGRSWPYLDVEQRRYRFRFLNGCDSRFLVLQFDNSNVDVWQIGNEGGFLAAAVHINDLDVGGLGSALLMGPAERADVIVDFSQVPVGTEVTLLNLGPDEPFGGFPTPAADPNTTGQVMQFRVKPATGPDPSTPPQNLVLPAIPALSGGATRQLALLEMMSTFPGFDGPAEAMLGRLVNGMPQHQMWAEPISENPAVGDTEMWEFYNFTADAHPMHIHEVAFEVVDRQALELDPISGEPVAPAAPVPGTERAPEPWENGLKDTVIAYPGEVTRVRAKFEVAGQFVWHCHIVEHEDNEMMRPYRIGPEDPLAPKPKM